jgi:hypothetical protein
MSQRDANEKGKEQTPEGAENEEGGEKEQNDQTTLTTKALSRTPVVSRPKLSKAASMPRLDLAPSGAADTSLPTTQALIQHINSDLAGSSASTSVQAEMQISVMETRLSEQLGRLQNSQADTTKQMAALTARQEELSAQLTTLITELRTQAQARLGAA